MPPVPESPLERCPRRDRLDLAAPRRPGPQPRWRDGVDWEGAARARPAWVLPLLCFVAGVLVGLLHGVA